MYKRQVLYNIALGLTSAENILTVAPAMEQSGVSHAISYHGSITLNKLTENRWSLHGTPADCVIVGISEYKHKFDLVLSGVNRGNNAGQNTMYSGTVGATIEASMNRIPAIALSQFFGPKLNNDNIFNAAACHGLKTIENILSLNSSKNINIFENTCWGRMSHKNSLIGLSFTTIGCSKYFVRRFISDFS